MLRKRKPPSAAKALTAMTVAPLNGARAEEAQVDQGFGAPGLVREQSGEGEGGDGGEGEDRRRVRRSGASMIAYVSEPRSAMTSSWPTGSGRRGLGARDSGT